MAEDKPQKWNDMTLQWEDAPVDLIAPSPTDQRILAAPPHTDPLPDLVARVVNHVGDDAGVNVEEHTGPSLQGDPLPGETPLAYIPNNDEPPLVLNPEIPEQHKDVPPPNDPLIESLPDVTPADYGPYPGQDVSDFVKSLDERDEAKANDEEVPPVRLPEPLAPLTTDDEPAPEPNVITADEPEPAPEEKPKRRIAKKEADNG